jgi:hypothetical protein
VLAAQKTKGAARQEERKAAVLEVAAAQAFSK